MPCSIVFFLSQQHNALVRYSLYKVKRIGDKQHRFLISLPNFTLLVSAYSSFSLTSRSTKFADQSSFATVDTSLLQDLHGSALIQAVHCLMPLYTASAQSLSSTDIILNIPIVSLVHFPLLHPNGCYPSTSSSFLSILLLGIFVIIFALCLMFVENRSFRLLLNTLQTGDADLRF